MIQKNSPASRFPTRALKILRDAIKLRDEEEKLSDKEYQIAAWKLEQRLDRLLARRTKSDHNRRLASRMRRYRHEWFPFLYYEDVDATNNLAERQIRPFVLCRKISSGNRSEWGAELQATIMSVFATCRQRGQDFVATLTAALAQPQIAHL